MKEEEKKLYCDALEVQNACNLIAVVGSFHNALKELRGMHPEYGTDELSKHPISVLFSSKIESLTGSSDRFLVAFNVVSDIVEKECL